MTPQQMRDEFQHLRSEDLLNIARNESAVGRLLALELLVSRGSPLCGHPEIAAAAEQFVLSNPIVLKKIDPHAVASAIKLPGVVDCLDHFKKTERGNVSHGV
jgi:hypothetical protein